MSSGQNKKTFIFFLILMLAAAGLLFISGRRSHDEPAAPVEVKQGETVFSREFDMLFSMAVSPCGQKIATGKTDEVEVIEIVTGELKNKIFIGNTGPVESVSFSPCGAILAIGGNGASLYDVTGKEIIRRLHGGFNSRTAFSPTDNMAASGNRRGIIWLWDAETGQELAAMEPGEAAFTSAVRFAPDGGYLASGHFDGRIHYRDVSERKKVYTFYLGDDVLKPAIADIAISHDGKVLAGIGVPFMGVHMFDLDSGRAVDGPELEDPAAFCLDFSPCGDFLAVGGRQLRVLDAAGLSVMRVLEPPAGEEDRGHVRMARFSSDGSVLAAVYLDNSLHVFRMLD